MTEPTPQREAELIYRALLGRAIPPPLAERFAATPTHVFPPLTDQQRAAYARLIVAAPDLEALELAARVRGRLLLLRLKMQLMIHLAECRPECRDALVNRRDRCLPCVLVVLGLHMVRSGYKFLKGAWLLRRYDGP